MEYRLQRPELVRTEFHSRSLEGIAGQLEQEELRQEKRDRYIDQICAMIREGFPLYTTEKRVVVRGCCSTAPMGRVIVIFHGLMSQ